MSKKNKAKFKKQVKNQVLQQMTKANMPSTNNQLITRSAQSTIATSEIKNVAAAAEIQNLPQIQADLKKTAIVIAALALAIVVLAELDRKHNILLIFGNWLFRVLHIQ